MNVFYLYQLCNSKQIIAEQKKYYYEKNIVHH